MAKKAQTAHPAHPAHPERKEIARYLLSRGSDGLLDDRRPAAVAAPRAAISFPDGLAPAAAALNPAPSPRRSLPRADVVVLTWTIDEVEALAQVLTPGVRVRSWHPYARNFVAYAPKIRARAPAAMSRRLGSYFLSRIGSLSVLVFKSELHLNQDGIETGDGTATLPVKDLLLQIISEARPSHVLTVGTAGSVFEEFGLGDVVVTRAARFRCTQEFRNEAFNDTTFTSDWEIPTTHLASTQAQMRTFSSALAQPPVGPPTKSYDYSGALMRPPKADPTIRLDGRDMPAFHPILSTDYFEFGTSANRLDRHGAAVEMGDAVLGLAAAELVDPPKWAVVRNLSNPVINGDLPTKEYPLNEQTTWAVAYYAAYGRTTSLLGSLVTWAVLAGLVD